MLLKNSTRMKWIVTLGAAGALVAGVLTMRYRETCSGVTDTFKWIWHMTHEDQYGHNGMHLEPGREYYIPEYASTFVQDYYPVSPVSADVAELTDLVAIGVVRFDQKIDHEFDFKRTRTLYETTKTAADLGLVVNGDYFFTVTQDDSLGDRITINQALRKSRYMKISVYLQKIVKAEEVERIVEWYNRYTYWTITENRKENVGYRIENGKRTDWRDCYGEQGGHASCPDTSKKP